jgi:hypothetical protein
MKQAIPKAQNPETLEIRKVCIANVIRELHSLDENEAYTVKIERNRDRRTLDQNSKFHAMASELAGVVGYTPDELKRAVKKELGFYRIVSGPLGSLYRWESSADWDTEKMSRAIEQLNAWAIECDHVWRLDQ